jgi:hypothetical protein
VEVLPKKIQSLLDSSDIPILIVNEGPSYTFQISRSGEIFRAAGTTAVTIDPNVDLFRELFQWRRLPVYTWPAPTRELQDWDSIISRLNALDDASGLLDELTSEQKEAFEAAIKRRPLFK